MTLVHRRDRLRAEKILQDRLFEREREGKASIIWNHTVDEVLGDDSGVTGLRIAAVAGGQKRELKLHGVFIAVGHTPNTQLFEGQLRHAGRLHRGQGRLEGDATGDQRCRACSPPATSPTTSTGRP